MRHRRVESGIHLLELSVAVIVGVSLVLGVVDVMHYLQAQTALQNGAEFSARLLGKALPVQEQEAFQLAAKEVQSGLPVAEYPCASSRPYCISFSKVLSPEYVQVTAKVQIPLYVLAWNTDEIASSATFKRQNKIVDDAARIENTPCEEVGCNW